MAVLCGLRLLQAVADDLDSGGIPRVRTGGFIVPDPARWGYVDTGSDTECFNLAVKATAPSGTQGSAARQRQRTTGDHPAQRAWATGAAAQELGRVRLKNRTAAVLEETRRHYPQLEWRLAFGTIWSWLWIRPIAGLPDKAVLITRHGSQAGVRHTWAWWNAGVWIGPRHTNMGPNVGGSICAYDATDAIGDEFTTQLDLMSLWAARHLHLAIYGRWPGRQVLHTAYERLHEHGPSEFCGCASGNLYEECCREKDRILSPAEVRSAYVAAWPRPSRRIPPQVISVRQIIWQ